MELPKNITQVGEVNRTCKVYVEDYVISYLKQLNRTAADKDMAVAMYGVRKEEGEVAYLFFYGACKLDFLQRETRHLSQAQQQEIEKARRRYFAEYQFLGYRLLNGEMIEGFHICEQGICRYIGGYAQFYEKNDAMLAYMLEVREQETAPEVVDSEKYDMVKRRQEERRAQTEGLSEKEREDLSEAWKSRKSYRKQESTGLQGMKLAVAAVFALLCLAGIFTLRETGSTEDIQVAARDIVKGVTEQKLPDAQEADSANVQNSDNHSVLVTEDKLSQALQKENQEADKQKETQDAVNDGENKGEGNVADTNQNPVESSTDDKRDEENATQMSDKTQASAGAKPVSYTIKAGDTLNAISLRNYGTKERVAEICKLNEISDPDDIKVGQKILLP
ncbi:MAG: LysM peptidoglycan-binding domain-containing protein [Bacteroidales bacterium]|nr:LysM peptidoglycan-binding domain-containing protein [Lachnoclostridium sp.]MCM1384608.1 LysM peptidoglycan-binding domain-containing protein [Lachnoclostridium sp.]MCM1465110.1 LysM peptidoglycan-binding domain-containing protein [Bacteroidales bacterium]